MHTIMVIGGGLVLFAILAFGARLFGGDIAPAVKIFVPLWLVAALVNMWIGVTRAGYSVAAEAPIALVVFAVPALVALFIGWKFS